MRPPAPKPASKHRFASLIVLAGLLAGIMITTWSWLKLPDQLLTSLFWLSLSLIGLGSFLYLRNIADPRPRWITVLAALAAVSLVYLFPALFGPACGGMPRAFALNCPRECEVKECTKWVPGPSPECPNPGSGGGCCLSYETSCDPNCDPPPSPSPTPIPTATQPPNQPPTISKTTVCSKWGQNGWCTGSMTLQLTANEPQGKQVQISGAVAGTPFACPAGSGSVSCSVPLPQGAGTASYVASSITGLTAFGSTTYKHDSTPPLVNGSLSGASGANGWFLSSVEVSATAIDPQPGSGSPAIDYSLNAAGWVSYTEPLHLSDGIYSLGLRATDAAGNSVDLTQTIQVDTVTPALDLSVTGSPGSNGWHRSNVVVSAVGSDLGSSLDTLEYNLDGLGWADYTAPLEMGDGFHSLSLRAVDVAGNSTSWSESFQVDTLSPVLDLTINGTLATSGWYTSPVQLNITGSDPGFPSSEISGLSTLEYNLDSAGWVTYSSPLDLKDGIHTLDVQAVDGAGNRTSASQSFKVDTGAPSLNVSARGTQGLGQWFVTVVQVEAVAGDETSALSALEMKVDGGDWSLYSAPLAFGDGPHSYRFRATDNAGNQVVSPVQTFQVDTLSPAISLPVSWEVGETAEFSLLDSGSGLASVRLVIEDEDERYPKVTWEKTLSSYSYSGEINWDGRFSDKSLAPPGGTYYATLKVTDKAGNESRAAGQIQVPLLTYVDTILDTAGSLVAGTEGKKTIDPLIEELDTEEEPGPTLAGGAPSTLTFGGENTASGGSGEQSALNLGGENNGTAQPSSAETGTNSFSAGGQSTLPIGEAPSNVLWGATATAAIGAFAAEILRKKKEEEAAAAALAAEQAKKQESREGSRYRQKVKAKKQAKLEIKWAMERAEAEQQKQAEQRKQAATNPRVTAKEEAIEAEMRAYGNMPQELGESYYQYLQQKAYETYRAGEVTTQTKITPPPPVEKSRMEKSLEWIDAHQKQIALGLGVAVGIAAIVLTAGTATPLVAAGWAALAAGTTAGIGAAAGTAALNAHFGRDLSTNILRNVGLAAIPAAVVAGVGVLLVGAAPTGMITGGTQTASKYQLLNNAVHYWYHRSVIGLTRLCMTRPGVCGKAESFLTTLDTIETLSLEAKLAWQTVRGDQAGAAETALEIQMEKMDLGTPGNTALSEARELVEDITEASIRYADDIGYFAKLYGDDAVRLIRDHGEDGIIWLYRYGKKAWLRPLLDDDLFEMALKLDRKSADALKHWTDDEILKYGAELIERASKDAIAIEAASELAKLNNVDSPEARKLIETIAENSIMGEGDRLVLGKWVPKESLDGGFIGTARHKGGLFYGTNPGLEKALSGLPVEDQEKLFWAVNQQVLQKAVNSELKIEYSFNGFSKKELDKEIQAIQALASGQSREEIAKILGKFPFRMREVEFLVKQGYKYEIDLTTQAVRFTKP